MDVPIGWQETKLPLNPDTRKLGRWLREQYKDSSGPDEKNFQIQRRGQDRVFLISRKELNQDEIRKAATKTKGAKLPVSQEPSSLSLTPEPKPEPKSANMFGTGETAEPDLISETRENPAATFNTHPGRSTSLKTPPPARKFTLKRSATSTWNFLKGFARTVNWLNTGTTQRDT